MGLELRGEAGVKVKGSMTAGGTEAMDSRQNLPRAQFPTVWFPDSLSHKRGQEGSPTRVRP